MALPNFVNRGALVATACDAFAIAPPNPFSATRFVMYLEISFPVPLEIADAGIFDNP